MVVYISTSCLKNGRNLPLVLEQYNKYEIENVEIGSNHYYLDDLSVIFSYQLNYLVHNYFPPLKESLIINLGSQNKSILRQSIRQVRKSIDLCAILGSPFYTFHSPYRQDPTLNVEFEFSYNRPINDYEDCYRTFVNSLKELNEYSIKKNIKLVVENNIMHTVIFGNLREFCMLTTQDEFIRLFNDVNSKNLKMLLDLGHLNVNAYHLKFDKFEFIDALKEHVEAFHIHDNSGKTDSHSIITEKSWFLYLLNDKPFKKLAKILECINLDIENILKAKKILEATD